MEAFEDPNNPGNSLAHRTGKRCIEPGCGSLAGTAWSPYWCQSCNVARMKRIGDSLRSMRDELAARHKTPNVLSASPPQ